MIISLNPKLRNKTRSIHLISNITGHTDDDFDSTCPTDNRHRWDFSFSSLPEKHKSGILHGGGDKLVRKN